MVKTQQTKATCPKHHTAVMKKMNISTSVQHILRRAGSRDRTVLYFVAYHHDLPIPGDVIGEDLKLLTASHISAILQYPLSRVLAQTEVTRARWSPWLTISLIISSGVLLLCVGWFILFIYFNSCGARPLYQGVSKIVYQKDDTTQCETPVLLHGESRDKPDRIVDETRKHADENPE
ncbi:unnamed protein product [Nippostrongylus brasiliensis]|uniref:SLC3A2_N domain-containing protein n=1 Tax=Nippostrongylus brasiliensis TaxID=27835 RepID=A0A0N4XVH1_NIPBR|nr:unnamed protein product [Nippostrongylus brasiliensis]